MNITFHPLVSWTFFFGMLLLLVIAAAWPIILQAKKNETTLRIALKSAFAILFLFGFSMAILRPSYSITGEKEAVLVYGKDVEKSTLDFWKDSLSIRRAVRIENFKPGSNKVYLLGNQFEKSELYPLKDVDFEWIAPEQHGEITQLAWKGYLRKGEKQRLNFEVFSTNDSATFSIDGIVETQLHKGRNSGLVEFPISGQGQVQLPLVLDADTLSWMRFYVGPATPKKYHFIAGFPNPELRNLAQWLRNKGETVSEEIKLSRETLLSSGVKTDSMQVIFLDPGALGRRDIDELSKEGNVGLVVWNVSNPQETAQLVNRTFGTDFKIEKITAESSRILENGAEALPFAFLEQSGQKLFQERSLAVQNPNGAPIALSLITSTFPLALQGKGEEYESVWGELIGALEPEENKSWRIAGPLLAGFSKDFELIQKDSLPTELIFSGDTTYLSPNPINPAIAKGSLMIQDTSWVRVAEALSVYAYTETELPTLTTAAMIQEIQDSKSAKSASAESERPIPIWVWMLLMLVFLGLLWLEPKLDF